MARDGQEGIYVTNLYAGTFGGLAYAVRTTADAQGLVRQIRSEVDALDPMLPLSDVRTMEARVDEAMTETRFAMALIGAFGFMALALASIGIYGVLSHTVRQRVGEIGVRMALGAQAGNILKLVIRQGLTLTGVGLVAGLVASVWATQLMQSLLVDVPTTDVTTYVAMALVFVVVAVVASWLPARRATRIDPVVALREE